MVARRKSRQPFSRAPLCAAAAQVGNAITDSLCFVLVAAGVLMNRNRLKLVRQGIYKRFLSLDYSTQARADYAAPRLSPYFRRRTPGDGAALVLVSVP